MISPETKAKLHELIKGTKITESMIETAYENGALEGEEKGMAKGREQGQHDQLQRTILNAFDKGLEILLIAGINECTVAYVESILKEHQRIK